MTLVACCQVAPVYLAASVWVETNRAERLRRGLRRDGQDALSLWQEWMRAEDDDVAAERPHQAADLVVSGESAEPDGG